MEAPEYRPIWTLRFAHPLMGDDVRAPAYVVPARRSTLSGACPRRSQTVASHNLRHLWNSVSDTATAWPRRPLAPWPRP